MGDVLQFLRPVKRINPLLESYWNFWNPFFSWQDVLALNAALAELSEPEDCA